MYDMIIIGAGIGGLSAAIYARRFKLNVLVISKDIGGTTLEAHKVENYPSHTSISGIELMKKTEEHAKSQGVEIKVGTVEKTEKTKEGFEVDTGEARYKGKVLILAMGSERRKLDVDGEKDFLGKGVSYCATCDAPFFKDKVVGVVGGSDAAAQSALLVAEYAKKVYIIYRKDKMRAEPIHLENLENNDKIEFVYNANVIRVFGETFMKGVELDTGNKLELDGMFIEVGSVPSTALAIELGVDVDDTNYIKTDKEQKTNIPGVFSIGDVTDTPMRQAIVAAGQGAVASQSAYRFLKNG